MKKFLALLLVLSLAVFSTAFAEEEGLTVFVSITDETGALVLAYEPVTVTDLDADGAVTINDALIAAHTAKHENGADAYGSAMSEYGMSLTKLWGFEGGSGYGYCLNNASATSLLDPVAEYNHVKAYVYTDTETWSDTYCYFDAPFASLTPGATISLTLTANGYDADWNPVTMPVEGATLTVNGTAVEAVTDAAGLASLTFTEEGKYVVSAVSDTQVLVAPVILVYVSAE